MSGHLFESTLVLAIAILLARMPRLAARTRYAIVFAALMKFAVPSAIVPRVLAFLGIDLARMPKGTIVIEALGPLSASEKAALPIAQWPAVLITLWLVVAIGLLVRTLVRGRAALRRALADGYDASPGELATLGRALARTRLDRPVRLVRSQPISAPATAGMLRPVILIPAATQLSADELETILTHECAHIARHDNLLGLIESIAGCVLWFHPLVWIARHILDAAREEACDAVVVASGDSDTYISALRKVCEAAIGPRVAAVSCVVSNTIRERMEAIMNFGSRRLLNHRAVFVAVVATLSLATLGLGVARALPSGGSPTSKYKVGVTLTREASPDVFNFEVTVCDRSSGVVVSTANLRSSVEQWALATSEMTSKRTGHHTAVIRAIGHADGTAEVETTVDQEPVIVARIVAKRVESPEKLSDDGITLDLKDADIRDVLKTFAQLTSTEIVADDDVHGTVTLTLHNTPWQEGLEKILADANLRSESSGNTIHVHRR